MRYDLYWRDGSRWIYLASAESLAIAKLAAYSYSRATGRDCEIRWGDSQSSGALLICAPE